MTETNDQAAPGYVLRSGFGFKTVWVLESLPDGEYRTGKELYDGILLPRHRRDPGLLVEFVDVADREGLFRSLEQIRSTLASTGQVPLIHFETHGNEQGLGLKSGEFVCYEELCPVLREINILSQDNLFVVVAACQGSYLAFMLKDSLTDPCPFWGICGPSVEITAGDVIAGYSAFYEEALVSADMNKALTCLKRAIPHHADKFNIWNSEYLFLIAFRHYLRDHCNEEAIEKRAQMIITEAELGLRGRIDTAKYGDYIRQRLGTEDGQKQEFKRMVNSFFMHDKFPENSELPDPCFEDMMKVKLIGGESSR